jgi:hypothetical protein
VNGEEITRTNKEIDHDTERGRRFLELHVDGPRRMQPLLATYTAPWGELFPKKTKRMYGRVLRGKRTYHQSK